MIRRVERVGSISRDALYVDERYEPEEFRCTRWRSDQTSEETCCKHCLRPLTAYREIPDGVHPECKYAADVLANPPKDILRVRDCGQPKLYRFRWPGLARSEPKAAAGRAGPIDHICVCSAGHTATCRQRKRRKRIADERKVVGIPIRPRGRPCKPDGPRRTWGSAWLEPWQVDWMRGHGLSISDYFLIVNDCSMYSDPVDRVRCFANLVERDASKGNENAARLVAALKALLTIASVSGILNASTLTANAAT
jgi:hypothetical protein